MLTPLLTINELEACPPIRIYTAQKGSHWLSVKDLIYLEGDTCYTWILSANNRRILQPHTLKSYEEQLPASAFIRIHRRYLVNRWFVKHIEWQEKKAMVFLTTGVSLPVSRRRHALIRQQMNLPVNDPKL